jgi:hypothetical protein
MDKFNSSKGFRRHVFIISLIFFLLSTLITVNNLLAGTVTCQGFKEYSCTAVEKCDGEPVDSWEVPCASLCTQPDGYVYLDAVTYFHCNLGFVNSKKLLGSGATIIEGGCSVNLEGRSMTVDIVDTDAIGNCVVHLNCTPCNNCCSI